MKKLLLVLLLCYFPCCFAHETAVEENNIAIVKNMFTEFAEGLDLSKLDTYYTKDFMLESNGERFNYTQYKNLEEKIYKHLKSLKVIKYDDIFAHEDKVVSRMAIRLVRKNGKTNEFTVFLIALIKDNKIDKAWELTYPSWSDKVGNR